MSGPIRNLIARVRANRPQRQQRRAERRERRRETLRNIINPMESIGNADAAASKPRRFELFRSVGTGTANSQYRGSDVNKPQPVVRFQQKNPDGPDTGDFAGQRAYDGDGTGVVVDGEKVKPQSQYAAKNPELPKKSYTPSANKPTVAAPKFRNVSGKAERVPENDTSSVLPSPGSITPIREVRRPAVPRRQEPVSSQPEMISGPQADTPQQPTPSDDAIRKMVSRLSPKQQVEYWENKKRNEELRRIYNDQLDRQRAAENRDLERGPLERISDAMKRFEEGKLGYREVGPEVGSEASATLEPKAYSRPLSRKFVRTFQTDSSQAQRDLVEIMQDAKYAGDEPVYKPDGDASDDERVFRYIEQFLTSDLGVRLPERGDPTRPAWDAARYEILRLWPELTGRQRPSKQLIQKLVSEAEN